MSTAFDHFRDQIAPKLDWLIDVVDHPAFRPSTPEHVDAIEAELTGPALPYLVALLDYGDEFKLERVPAEPVAIVALRRRLEGVDRRALRTVMEEPAIRKAIEELVERWQRTANDFKDESGLIEGLDQALKWVPDRDRQRSRATALDNLDAVLAHRNLATWERLAPREVSLDFLTSESFRGVALSQATDNMVLVLQMRARFLRALLEWHSRANADAVWHGSAFGKHGRGPRPKYFTEAACAYDLLAVCGEPAHRMARGRRDDAIGRFLGAIFPDTLTDPRWRKERRGAPGRTLRNFLRRYPKPVEAEPGKRTPTAGTRSRRKKFGAS